MTHEMLFFNTKEADTTKTPLQVFYAGKWCYFKRKLSFEVPGACLRNSAEAVRVSHNLMTSKCSKSDAVCDFVHCFLCFDCWWFFLSFLWFLIHLVASIHQVLFLEFQTGAPFLKKTRLVSTLKINYTQL